MNKIDISSAGLTKKKKEKTEVTKMKNERRAITTDPREIKRIVKEYYKQVYYLML